MFWEIALPVMVVIITIFFWREFGRMFNRLKRVMQNKKIDKVSAELLSSSSTLTWLLTLSTKLKQA